MEPGRPWKSSSCGGILLLLVVPMELCAVPLVPMELCGGYGGILIDINNNKEASLLLLIIITNTDMCHCGIGWRLIGLCQNLMILWHVREHQAEHLYCKKLN